MLSFLLGHFYKEQLTKTEEPIPGKTYHIEKVLKTEIRDGREMSLVKFLHYPNKYNMWLLTSSILKGEK